MPTAKIIKLSAFRLNPPADRTAEEVGALWRRARRSLVESVQYALIAGRKLIAKKRELSHGAWLPWLEKNAEVLGFADPARSAQRLMRAARKYDAGVVFDPNQALTISREIYGHTAFMRGREAIDDGNEWYTPLQYLSHARRVLGAFDLDPATSRHAQRNVRAARYFTLKEDGLKQPWHGRVWLNPPYAQPAVAAFVNKLVAEWGAGHVTAGIMLTHNFSDTAWFQQAAAAADALCFSTRRVPFVHQTGGAHPEPRQGQTFFYFGGDVQRFAAEFSAVGSIMLPWRPAGGAGR